MRLYRLPSGGTTTDIEEYAVAWTTLGDELVKLLPGYQTYGFDPGISIGLANYKGDVIQISAHMAKTLINTFEALKLELCSVRAQLVDRLLEDALRHD